LATAFIDSLIVADAKPGRRAAILALVNTTLRTRVLSRQLASSLRGKSHFLASTSFGRMGRAPEQALVKFEFDPDDSSVRGPAEIPDYLDHALQLLRALILRAPARSIFLQPRYKAPTLVYTDASYEEGAEFPCIVGAVIFSERRPCPQGYSAVVPQTTLDALLPRRQQITPAETLGAPLVLHVAPDLLADADVLWFIDNSGAEGGLISGYSGNEDSAAILGYTHVRLASLNSRVWWDRVPSKENPSDGLSREGIDDPWTRAQGWDLHKVEFPDFSNLRNRPLDELLARFPEVPDRVPDPHALEASVAWKAPEVPQVELLRARYLEKMRLATAPASSADLLPTV
jgi:hypothetical protein